MIISEAMQTAVTPVFLLTGIGALLNVMMSRLPEIPKIMDQATKALEVFISRSDSSSSDPTIAKNLEIEKTKLRNDKNSFIIKILVAVVVTLLIFK